MLAIISLNIIVCKQILARLMRNEARIWLHYNVVSDTLWLLVYQQKLHIIHYTLYTSQAEGKNTKMQT